MFNQCVDLFWNLHSVLNRVWQINPLTPLWVNLVRFTSSLGFLVSSPVCGLSGREVNFSLPCFNCVLCYSCHTVIGDSITTFTCVLLELLVGWECWALTLTYPPTLKSFFLRELIFPLRKSLYWVGETSFYFFPPKKYFFGGSNTLKLPCVHYSRDSRDGRESVTFGPRDKLWNTRVFYRPLGTLSGHLSSRDKSCLEGWAYCSRQKNEKHSIWCICCSRSTFILVRVSRFPGLLL